MLRMILPCLAICAGTAFAGGFESPRTAAEEAFGRAAGARWSVLRRATPVIPAAEAGPVAARPERPARSFRLEISGVCGGRRLFVPAWCVVAGAGDEDGATIRVGQGDRVELELIVTQLWGEGVHAFVLSSGEPGDCPHLPPNVEPAPQCRDFPLFGVNETVPPASRRVVRFRAEKSGNFKFFDSLHPSGYGRLIVE